MNRFDHRKMLIATVLAILFAACPPVLGADCNRIKIWTFNIRFFNGPCSTELDAWDYCVLGEDRRERARAYLARYDPDIFGLQEVRPGQFDDIRSWFPDVTHGQYSGLTTVTLRTPIFWRRSRFSLQSAGTFWLSCTPDTPGSQHPSANEERVANWVRLRHRDLGEELFVFNTHWSLNEEAQKFSAAVLREKIEEVAPDARVVVMGDLNIDEDTFQFDMLTGESPHPTHQFLNNDCPSFTPADVPLADLELHDLYRDIDPDNTARDETTLHGFTGKLDHGSVFPGARIDFVLANAEPGAPGVRAAAACIRRDTFPGLACEGCLDPETRTPTDGCVNPSPPGDCCYPSDHFAVDFDLWLLLQDSWVDFSASGCETGKSDRPFNQVNQGINVLRPGGTLRVRAGSSPDPVTINPGFPMIVRAEGGRVVIGEAAVQ